jgi:hypothetical protein
MKVFTIEFTAFNQVYWKNVDYRIIAQSLEELEKVVRDELQWCKSLNTWETLLPRVREEELIFPIIHKSVWSN